jgi:uncharacterized membrane protein YqjE
MRESAPDDRPAAPDGASGADFTQDIPGDVSDEPGATAGLSDRFGRLAASVAAAVETRVQIAALEFAEERDRAKDRLVLVLVAAVSAGFAVLAANALAVALLWPHIGWASLALLIVLWTVVAAVAGSRLSQMAARDRRPFSATLAEFERDRAWIAERFARRPR